MYLHKIGIGSEVTHATVLFVDMRGYTRLAQRLPPERVVSLLEEFFDILARVTNPLPAACAALAAGDGMLQSFSRVAARWRGEFEVSTGIGIGLHSGQVALGFLGPPGKQAITMIGDTANVAARLCSRARAGEILFSCPIAAALGAAHPPGLQGKPFLQLPRFELRGRDELLDIWCLPAVQRLGLSH